jgi:hypothetical protein
MAGVSTDTVPAMLTPGEFVIKRESAAMLGEPFLRKLNAVSDNATQGFHAGGGVNQNNRPHGNIDALIGQAQLANMSGDVDRDNLEILKSLIDDAKWSASRSGTIEDMVKGHTPLEQLEPLKNPFKDIDFPPDVLVDTPWQGILRDFPAPWSSEEQKVKDMGGRTFGDYEKSMNRAMSMFPEAYQDEPESKSWIQRILGRQEGGYMQGYENGGGEVAPGYQEGGGVGEAGRQYPPGTLMSPFMGDTVFTPEAQDATATTPFQSLVQAAEFDKMVKMLMAQAALQKAKQANEVGEAEKIEWDGKSVLPPWEGKRNFKGNLYEDNIEFPVYREGNPQIYLQ